ncbi:hypothetical protein BTHI11S_03587 [Bosea thiooxidans]
MTRQNPKIDHAGIAAAPPSHPQLAPQRAVADA